MATPGATVISFPQAVARHCSAGKVDSRDCSKVDFAWQAGSIVTYVKVLEFLFECENRGQQ